MNTSFENGKLFMAEQIKEVLGDYATALAGLPAELVTPTEMYTRVLANLSDYIEEITHA